jgi:hypothetical protein
MALVLFTPWTEETHPIRVFSKFGIPDLSFRREDIVERFGRIQWTSEENLTTETTYAVELVFLLERASA